MVTHSEIEHDTTAAVPVDWRETELAFTGRLASMRRAEAVERIEALGGRVVELPSKGTRYLVVGQGGPPLGEDGRLTKSLRQAHALQEAGAGLEIVGEEAFLTLLGLEDRQADLQRLYTTQQLARILEIPRPHLRRWIRMGLIRPVKEVRRLRFFDFRQVATARRLANLCREGVSAGELRKSFEELSHWLPDAGAALAQLEVLEADGAIGLRTAEGLLAEPSGQLRLGFDEVDEQDASGTGVVVPEPRVAPIARQSRTNAEAALLPWFERALLFEEVGRVGDAIEAYGRALEEDGERAEVLFNLGNAHYALEQYEPAAEAFHRAVALDAEFVEAWNNLGNTFGRMERTAEAVSAFERALALEPDYADAHFNLAETLAAGGDVGAARRHWRAYLAEDPHSPWADVVRERLRLTP